MQQLTLVLMASSSLELLAMDSEPRIAKLALLVALSLAVVVLSRSVLADPPLPLTPLSAKLARTVEPTTTAPLVVTRLEPTVWVVLALIPKPVHLARMVVLTTNVLLALTFLEEPVSEMASLIPKPAHLAVLLVEFSLAHLVFTRSVLLVMEPAAVMLRDALLAAQELRFTIAELASTDLVLPALVLELRTPRLANVAVAAVLTEATAPNLLSALVSVLPILKLVKSAETVVPTTSVPKVLTLAELLATTAPKIPKPANSLPLATPTVVNTPEPVSIPLLRENANASSLAALPSRHVMRSSLLAVTKLALL